MIDLDLDEYEVEVTCPAFGEDNTKTEFANEITRMVFNRQLLKRSKF